MARRGRRPPEESPSAGAPAAAQQPRWWDAAGLALVVLVAALLRLRALGGPGLWTDELVSWWAASAPGAAEVWSRVSGCMATPPLSFLVQHLSVAALGPSEWALRLPAAVAGIAAAGLVFAAGRWMYGTAAGLVAGLAMAIHPVHLWFSADGRPYGLAVLLAAGSTWALAALLSSGGWGAALAWGGCTAALLHTQFVFAPLPAAQALAWLLARRRDTPWRPAAAGAGLAALLSLPLLPQIARVAGRAPDLTWPTAGEHPPGIYAFLQTTPLATAVLLYLAAALALRPAGEPIWGDDRREIPRAHLLALVLSFLLPLLALSAAALLLDLPSMIKPRYAAAGLPAGVLLVGWLASRPARPAGRWLLGGAYLALMFLAGVLPVLQAGRSFNADAEAEDWRGALRYLREELRPGDLVLARSGLVEVEALYRGDFPEACTGYAAAPVSGFYLGELPDLRLLPHSFAPAPYPEDYRRMLAPPLRDHSRAWLVMMAPPDSTAYLRALMGFLQEAAPASLRVASSRTFGKVAVILLEGAGPPAGS